VQRARRTADLKRIHARFSSSEAMMRRFLFLASALAALAACGQTASTEHKTEGQYGSSSGPNPNLADIQNDAANTYPSLSEEGSMATTPGAEGGRSSATTAASEPGPAGDPNAQQQQTPP
jgi:hypothetical protein